MRAPPEVDREVRAIIDAWVAAYDRKDADAVLSLFGEGDDVIVFGTGVDEIRSGRGELEAQLRRDFSQADRLAFRPGEIRVGAAGDAAWATMAGAVVEASAGGQEISIPVRGTIVLARAGGRWLVQHAHLSAPLAGQAEGESFPVTEAG